MASPQPFFAATAVALALASSASAHADTYLETFDAPLNPAIWSLTTGGNAWTVDAGKLTITRNNGNNGHLAFLPELIGDFDVRFDYTLNWSNTYGYGDRIQLGVNTTTGSPQHSYVVGHTQEGSVFAAAVDPSARYGFGVNTPAGTMRITRTGSNINLQYLQAGNWITLQTGSDSRDMQVRLDNYIFNSFVSGSSVVIDNFSLTANQFSMPVPEPETWAMLLAGLGLVGFAARRRLG